MAVLLSSSLATDSHAQEANYDESMVPHYQLPDPLKLNDGKPYMTISKAHAGKLRALYCRHSLGGAPLPSHRIVKEKRATFAQTPEQIKRRPGAPTTWKNLFLADFGSSTAFDGAVRSHGSRSPMPVASAVPP